MRFQLCNDDLPERDRIPCWHDVICQDMFKVTPGRIADDPRFRAELDVHVAGRFTVADLECSDGGVARTAGNVSQGGGDSVLVCVATRSAQEYQIGEQEYLLAPGDVGVLPMDRRFRNSGGDLAFRSLLIPNAVLTPLLAGRELQRAFHLPAGSALGTLLRGSLDSAATQLPLLTDALGDAVLGNLTGLVALAAGTSEEGEHAARQATRAARLQLVKRHIGRHLAEPTLSPASVASALGMSVRQLHLLFEPTGETFAQYVLARRLEACRAALASPATQGRSVADVAFGWGFNSLSAFYRAFGAAFGVSPAGFRAMLGAGLQGA